jgi:hypothetical protein
VSKLISMRFRPTKSAECLLRDPDLMRELDVGGVHTPDCPLLCYETWLWLLSLIRHAGGGTAEWDHEFRAEFSVGAHEHCKVGSC